MVHATYNLCLALYLAHLLADFVLQTDSIVTGKRTGRWHSYALHGSALYLVTLAVVLVLRPDLFRTWTFHWVALSLCLAHLLLDRINLSLKKAGWVPDNVWTFMGDQAAHLATVIGGAFLVTHPPVKLLASYLQEIRDVQNKFLLVGVTYVLVIFGGGYFIRYLIAPLWANEPAESSQKQDEVKNAGLYIGWLERFLVLTAIFLQSPGTAGLILAAKSIARYPEMQNSGRFVEYVLIGTLLSISIAVCGGLILLKVFYGTVAIGK